MSIFLGLWKLLGWLKGSSSGPDPHRGLRIAALCNIVVIVMLVGVNVWQRVTINALKAWQAAVIEAVSHASDQRDGKGQLRLVKSGEILAHINALGRFRTDTIAARAKARADDAQHVIATERQDAAITRKSADDYENRLAAARADADALRRRLNAVRSSAADRSLGLRGAASTADGQRGGGPAPVSGLSAARPAPDATSATDGLPPSGDAFATASMSIDERQLATEQAIQLDELITSIENFAKVKR